MYVVLMYFCITFFGLILIMMAVEG